MKYILKQLAVFAVFIALCVGTVFGILTPMSMPVVAVGPMQITESANGLALFQSYRGIYYTFSPFNDYILENGQKKNFISSAQIAEHKYTSTFPLSKPEAIFTTVKNYLGIESPSETFTAGKTLTYAAQIQGNRLSISKRLYPASTKLETTATTLSFNSGDLLYDKSGNLYTFVSNPLLKTFQTTYGILLTPHLDDVVMSLPTKTLFIYNPNLAVVIKITASKNQIIKIDRNQKVVQIEETVKPKDNTLIQTVKLTIFNTPQEAAYSL